MNQLFREHKLILIILFLGVILILGGGRGTAVIHAADPIIVGCSNGVGDVDALIAAFDEANSDPDEDTISLGENCTYTLLMRHPNGFNALPKLVEDLILEGNGAVIERDDQAPDLQIIHVLNDSHLTARNLTLRNASAPANLGGAIFADTGTTLTLNEVVFEENYADQGGALYSRGETIIHDSHFRNNKAKSKGGAIYAAGALSVEGSDLYKNSSTAGGGAVYAAGKTAVNDSRFAKNDTDFILGDGGAIMADGALTVTNSYFAVNLARNGGAILGRDVQIIGSDFFGNFANDQGGGVYALDAARGIHNVRFDTNTAATFSGGGLFTMTNLNLQRSYFRNNLSGSWGGGLFVPGYGKSILVVNNLLENNFAGAHNGNALSLEVVVGGAMNVRHNTIVNINEVLPGSGIILNNNGSNSFDNNIVTGFEVGLKDTSGATVSRSNLYFNNGTNEQGLPTPGTGNLVAEPGFIGEGNYRLAEGSPAIDSGIDTPTADDILGTGRPQGAIPDRGAYEFKGETLTLFPVACAGGPAELIAAINAANRHFGPDVVKIEESECSYELSAPVGVFHEGGPSGLPAVMDTLWLDGHDATVQRQESAVPFRILEVYAPALTVENLTISNGLAEHSVGGGIFVNEATALRLNNARLLANRAYYGGGAFSVNEMRVENSTITGNEAHFGGGLYAVNNLVITNSVLSSNRAAGGGGLFAGYDLFMSNSLVTGNEAEEIGGGLDVGNGGSVTNTIFSDNRARDHGGAIYAYNGINVVASTFLNNAANLNGGALYIDNAKRSIVAENSVWLNNQAVQGAAVYLADTSTNVHIIRHNTFAAESKPEGAAVYLSATGSSNSIFDVQNNIMTGHKLGVMKENQGLLVTNVNLYFDNDTNEAGVGVSTNHIKADPQLRNLDGNDARLRKGSPAIDSAADLNVQSDRKGVTRPSGGGYDIGAYEYTPNTPPAAAADDYAILQDTGLEISTPGILSNDQDADGDPLAAVLESQPAHGQVALSSDGSLTYTPDAGFKGNDSFTYRADDYDDQSEPATVTIKVLPMGTNLPPVSVPDSYTTNKDTPLTISAPGVLGNDKDANGDPLTAILQSQPAHGSLNLKANGSFTYTPNAGYSGGDSFTYRANDGHAQSEPAVVTITVRPPGGRIYSVLLPLVTKP